ncbi:hypothetical protein EVAR_59031_1 [Eumeta japonica]|uniref:Uncharacterized protein n=1 Tax=Eumeta variegata TaxID=151549 RepID=A0A4C1Z923_EUMVA|nr:hypothetical protein EVAR_59031_1 [Eumeta japonica]
MHSEIAYTVSFIHYHWQRYEVCYNLDRFEQHHLFSITVNTSFIISGAAAQNYVLVFSAKQPATRDTRWNFSQITRGGKETERQTGCPKAARTHDDMRAPFRGRENVHWTNIPLKDLNEKLQACDDVDAKWDPGSLLVCMLLKLGTFL